jgi:hypothetical protein
MTIVRRISAAVGCAALVWVLGGHQLAGQARPGSAYTLQPSTYGMQLKTPDGRVVLESDGERMRVTTAR